MSYDMLNNNNNPMSLRPGCDPFDLPSNSQNNYNNNNNFVNNPNGMGAFPFKPLISYTPSPRPHLSMAEQAELEFELRYRGNMIVDQQRKIQQLEEELKRSRDQMDMMSSQISSYEQERMKERKKPQSRYWTPDEHQRFLEALTKYGHKDVKAISMHVSTRNATQVRTHAQKYFLRLERERRKKGDDDGARDRENDGYPSSGDELYNSDQSGSPIEELSPLTGISSSPTISASQPISILLQNSNSSTPSSNNSVSNNNSAVVARRRRSTSLITPSMLKYVSNHRDVVLAELPSWTPEDFDQFCKGLQSLADKQEELTQVCRAIREGFLPNLTIDDVEACYRLVNKLIKQKPAPVIPSISSPKRRRTSKPELPINMPLISEGILPAMGSMPSSFGTFAGMSNLSSGSLPPPQYSNANNNNSNNTSSVNLLPFQPSLGGLMNMNGPMRILEYTGVPSSGPSMAPLQMGNNMNLGMSSLGMGMSMMDVSSANMSSSNTHSPQQQQQQQQGNWNSLAFSFDIHQNSPSVALPQAAPLVSSHN